MVTWPQYSPLIGPQREQTLDLKQQEREDLEANLARTKEKLETETLCHNETKQR